MLNTSSDLDHSEKVLREQFISNLKEHAKREVNYFRGVSLDIGIAKRQNEIASQITQVAAGTVGPAVKAGVTVCTAEISGPGAPVLGAVAGSIAGPLAKQGGGWALKKAKLTGGEDIASKHLSECFSTESALKAQLPAILDSFANKTANTYAYQIRLLRAEGVLTLAIVAAKRAVDYVGRKQLEVTADNLLLGVQKGTSGRAWRKGRLINIGGKKLRNNRLITYDDVEGPWTAEGVFTKSLIMIENKTFYYPRKVKLKLKSSMPKYGFHPATEQEAKEIIRSPGKFKQYHPGRKFDKTFNEEIALSYRDLEISNEHLSSYASDNTIKDESFVDYLRRSNDVKPEENIVIFCKEGFSVASINLADRDLSRIDFSDAKFLSVNFSGATFSECHLIGASFEGCDLRDASMINAFCGSKTSFKNANMLGADVTLTQFADADFDGADIRRLTWYGADFRFARNLESAKRSDSVRALTEFIPQREDYADLCFDRGQYEMAAMVFLDCLRMIGGAQVEERLRLNERAGDAFKKGGNYREAIGCYYAADRLIQDNQDNNLMRDMGEVSNPSGSQREALIEHKVNIADCLFLMEENALCLDVLLPSLSELESDALWISTALKFKSFFVLASAYHKIGLQHEGTHQESIDSEKNALTYFGKSVDIALRYTNNKQALIFPEGLSMAALFNQQGDVLEKLSLLEPGGKTTEGQDYLEAAYICYEKAIAKLKLDISDKKLCARCNLDAGHAQLLRCWRSSENSDDKSLLLKAQALLLTATNYDPGYIHANYYYGLVLLEQENYVGAKVVLQKALRTTYNHPCIRVAYCLALMGRSTLPDITQERYDTMRNKIEEILMGAKKCLKLQIERDPGIKTSLDRTCHIAYGHCCNLLSSFVVTEDGDDFTGEQGYVSPRKKADKLLVARATFEDILCEKLRNSFMSNDSPRVSLVQLMGFFKAQSGSEQSETSNLASRVEQGSRKHSR